MSGLAAGSVASVRERETFGTHQRLDGLRVFLVAEPAMSALANAVTALGNLGGLVALDVSATTRAC